MHAYIQYMHWLNPTIVLCSWCKQLWLLLLLKYLSTLAKLLLSLIDFRRSSDTSKTTVDEATVSCESFVREIYKTYCTTMCRETDTGWLLELVEDIYNNEVKYCMKATLNAKKQVRHLSPCDCYTCWQWKLGYSFQGYSLSSSHSEKHFNLQLVIQIQFGCQICT